MLTREAAKRLLNSEDLEYKALAKHYLQLTDILEQLPKRRELVKELLTPEVHDMAVRLAAKWSASVETCEMLVILVRSGCPVTQTLSAHIGSCDLCAAYMRTVVACGPGEESPKP